MINRKDNKFSFFSKMSQFGFGNIFSSFDFFIALLLFILLFIDNHFNLHIFISTTEQKINYVGILLTASSILFALITTALSIIISFSTSNFIKFLKKNDMLDKIIFPFWLGNAVFLLTIILSIVFLLLDIETWANYIPYIFMIIVSLFLYAIGITFSLLRIIIRIGEWITHYEDNLSNN